MPKPGEPLPKRGQPLPKRGIGLPKSGQTLPKRGIWLPKRGEPLPQPGIGLPKRGEPLPRAWGGRRLGGGGHDPCVPSGLGRGGAAGFLGLKPQALTRGPFGAGAERRWLLRSFKPPEEATARSPGSERRRRVDPGSRSPNLAAREATSSSTATTKGARFQSTPPHGRRPGRGVDHHHGMGVSIHASAREATSAPLPQDMRPASFNPRLRTGGDYTVKWDITLDATFQSTPPHGRRHALSNLYFTPLEFQSTPPHGRRPVGISERIWFYWFQSTPPHGRRRARLAGPLPGGDVSIHASAREATTCRQ